MTLPLFVRKFLVDFAETALASLALMTFAFPQSLDDLKAIAVAVGVGVLGALISAGRRSAPDFLAWLRDKLGVTPA